jgi:hypothetical protein
MMNTTTDQMLESKFNLIGLILAIVGGAIAAVAMGYVYFLVANKVQIDYIIVLALVVGAIVGFVVGLLAKAGGLRATFIVFIIAFIFGVVGYGARYFFELNDTISTIVDQTGATRAQVEAQLADVYPPGGFMGYLAVVADTGFSISSRGSSSDTSSKPDLQGTAAYALLGVEALAAGLTAGFVARGRLAAKKQTAMMPPPSAGASMQMK